MLTNAAIHKREGSLPAPKQGRWRCAALLFLFFPSLQVPAQQTPAPDLRGVAAHLASDAAGEQLRPLPKETVEAIQPPQAEPGLQEPASVPAPVVADTAPVASPRRERGVLFKVTPPVAALLPAQAADSDAASPGMTSPVTADPPPVSYLLGTIHFGTPEEQGIDYGQLGRLIAESDAFVNEADIDSAWKPDYDGYRWLPVETPLEGMIGKGDMAQAQALLPAVRPQDLQRMKPWAVLALLEARGESGGDATMDARLQRMAAAAGKRMAHLETLEQQLQALDCVPAAEHAQVLGERLRASWILRIESAEAMAFYRSRNLDAWLASIDRMEGLGDTARAIEQRARICLLEDRNARWIGPLETLFQDGSSFVAVGAIHLVGAEGLIARLRRNGYQVEAVPL